MRRIAGLCGIAICLMQRRAWVLVGWSVLHWPAMATDTRTLQSDQPFAVELTPTLKQGAVDRLRRLLAAGLVERPGELVGKGS